MENSTLFGLLSSSLLLQRKYPVVDNWQYIFSELNNHEILLIPTQILTSYIIPNEIITLWKKKIVQQLAYNAQYKYIEKALPISVPYVILKGTTAAQYYPFPEFRTMGDIDIITCRDDYETACNDLIENGYQECSENEEKVDRHRIFVKQKIVVEVHRFFALLNDPNKAEYLDNLIIQNITASHILPDLINGLVLLEHISQHLEDGLGLRQVIDWMMFVDKCLPDDKWHEFERYVKKIGLEDLAIITTRMCEIYLNLPQRNWSKCADINICEELMAYVMACGNFGNKRTSDADISENAFSYANTPRMAFRLLQKQGLINWKAAQRHKYLKPFAWLYQTNRYIQRGLKREQALSKIRTEYKAAKKRNAMFRALGIKLEVKGIAIYKNGQFVKK